ncbi:nucleotidyltransferase family protein [soil metagenome]
MTSSPSADSRPDLSGRTGAIAHGLPDKSSVAGLLLAAGAGTRLGRPKALVELDGQRLVDRGVQLLRAGGCDPVIVVLGAAATAVPDAEVVHNPDWHSGMGSSLRVGLSALPDDTTAVVVHLVDMPDVTAAAVGRLLIAHGAGAEVAVATYGGRRGNPVLLARSTWPEVARLAEGDVGARPYLAAHADIVVAAACDDVGGSRDVDVPADLA